MVFSGASQSLKKNTWLILLALITIIHFPGTSEATVRWCDGPLIAEDKLHGEIQALDTQFRTAPEWIDTQLKGHLGPGWTEDPEVYRLFAADPAYTRLLLIDWYLLDGVYLEKWVSQTLGEKYLPLFLHPGVAFHHEAMIQFARLPEIKKMVEKGQYVEVIKKFGKSLGTRRVYRAMRLDSEAIEKFSSQGFDAPLFSEKEKDLEPFFNVRAYRSPGLKKDISFRVNQSEFGYRPASMSVTEIREVALGAAKDFVDKKHGEIILFTLDVPALDLISRTGIFDVEWVNEKKVIRLNGEASTIQGTDPGLEKFVFFRVKKEWIKSVETVNEKDAPSMDLVSP